MDYIDEERILSANGSEIAERLLAITGNRATVRICVWEDDDRDIEELKFPDMKEKCWFSLLGDDAMGSLVDIYNNEDGHLICVGHFGDDGPCDFNLHTEKFLNMQKIVDV